MGYACPVCGDPQADIGHLANHLAFTAILGNDAHRAWLEEYVPGWGEMGETELADALRESVEETVFPQVFEDTVGGLSDSSESRAQRSGTLFDDESEQSQGNAPGDHRHGDHRHSRPAGVDYPDLPDLDSAGPTDEETAAIIEEAREMTRAMLGAVEGSEGGVGEGQEGEDGDTDADQDGDTVTDRDQGQDGSAGGTGGNENE